MVRGHDPEGVVGVDDAGLHRLVTERLVLREVVAEDLDALLVLRNHPALLSLTGTGQQLPVERMARQLERWIGLWRTRGVGTWLVLQDGDPVGFVPLDPIGEGYAGVDPEAFEIGVLVHPDHWGRGIAREAGTAALQYCFSRGALERVYATVDADNTRSLGLLADGRGVRLLSTTDGEHLYELREPDT